MSLNTRTKNVLIISGTALICVGAMIAVLNMSSSAAATEPAAPASSSPSTSTVVSVPPIEQQFEAESGTSSAFVPESGANQTAELTKIEKPVSAPPSPSVASGTNLTDKNKKPSYSSSAPAKSSTTKKATSSTTKKPSSAPKGKSYMPGFGYVDGTGGGQMTKDKPTNNDGDINKQVGVMD
jgi:hypothetical protein